MDIPQFDDFILQIYKNIWVLGIPLDDTKIGFQFYVIYVCLVFMVIEELCFFWTQISSDNFLELTSLAPCIGIGVLSLAKILLMVKKTRRISNLITNLKQLYEEIYNNNEKKGLVKSDIMLVKTLTKYYFILNLILISVYNFSILFIMFYNYIMGNDVKLDLPYAVLVPFDLNKWFNWLVVYIHSMISGFFCVLFYTTVDALYCNLSAHVCSNFIILAVDIEKLKVENINTLPEIVQRHQYLLRLTDDLEDIFQGPNFVNVIVGSIEICALGFNIITGDWTQMPGYILFLLSELLQIWVMSFFGENIMRKSRKVGDSAFLCEWYKFDPMSKKIILNIITRAHKPQKLTALKYSVISYGSFTKIISTSWTYFTILWTVYKPSDVISVN